MKQAKITRVLKDNVLMPTYQVKTLAGIDEVASVLPYPLIGVPPKGAMAVILESMGHAESKHSIAHHPMGRKKNFEPGEGGIENAISKSYLVLLNNGNIEFVAVKDFIGKFKDMIFSGDNMTITLTKAATLTATDTVTVNTKAATINASDTCDINTKAATITATDSITATTKALKVTTDTAEINSTTSTITGATINVNVDTMNMTGSTLNISANVNLTGDTTMIGNLNHTGTNTNNGVNMTTHHHVDPQGGVVGPPV